MKRRRYKLPTNRTYVVYDGRAGMEGDTDEASVCCCADTLREAIRDVRDMFPDGCVYSYRRVNDKLVDERFEWSLIYERGLKR